MKRKIITPRKDWEKKVEEVGLVYHHFEGNIYWDESAYYEFTAKEVDELEAATNTLEELCLDAVQFVIDNDAFEVLHIPKIVVPMIKSSWDNDVPSIYGRFDLAYDGRNPPKLLEYNADTPTSLLEAAVVQWHWLQELFPKSDQFNSMHERLIKKWTELKQYITGDPLYFTHTEDVEDMMTTNYMVDTAIQAGFKTSILTIDQIGWNSLKRAFVDMEENEIKSIFKLYPWEWLINEEFGIHLIQAHDRMQWIEPSWKMVLSNKGILPILWEMNKGHPNLLDANFEEPANKNEYVKKPILSREGANISVKTRSGVYETTGEYGEEGFVYQELANVPNFDGNYPVIGSWVIDCESAGMGIRESKSLVTDNLSRFVPHLFG